jgi:hypothetical protein
VLIVALLVAAFIALILGGYLSLNLGTARLAQRGFDRGAAFHLAEAGLEEGLWAYNRALAGQNTAWTDWQITHGSAWRNIDGFALTGATRGEVKIHASPITPTDDKRPAVVALATVNTPGSAPVNQMVEVTLRRRSFFAAGLIAREKLVFNGNRSSFDSWDSDPDRDPATPAVPYAAALARDTGTIASAATEQSQINLSRARIQGYYRGTGLVPTVGSQGSIGSFITPLGEVDLARISGDFRAHFPAIEAPSDGTFITTFGDTLGNPGETTSWRAVSLHLNGEKKLTIQGDVTLVLTDPILALTLSGQAGIDIPEGASLAIYFRGDLRVTGGGFANANPSPAALQLWSTVQNPLARHQRITIAGRGSLSAVIYAPEASVTVNGNGDMLGAIVAREIIFNGNAAFHYDEALRQLKTHSPYRTDTWRTIDTPEERAALLPLFHR